MATTSHRGAGSIPPRPRPQPEPEPEPGNPEHLPGAPEEKPPEEAPHVVTVGEEQLKRSQEMQAMGVEKWMSQFDSRKPTEEAKSVPGVGFRER